ncbi:hypothetical protein A3H86_03640 [Candidatus Roizmanbacteria bacterium RIFCSPLOWO2_02_FULL_41_9]|uniref:Major facilitator superfamily (MFS) profile domain-containing protein n=1 Tax=Candidatus Roizmanbacteria bacterium RIFCSPLOWO2_02_FULL_41_9 TaxID=1802077 RepID=A0A1F7JS16_9BACT|nr:MAG: hypothetical protein A3H86_03640 [Candidatus Roizmanbacteria bacterium RIFCSPLOWO2_02_FULL_41_9]
MKKTDQYILNQSSEIVYNSKHTWTEKVLTMFPAFHSRNYRLYFSGQLISLIGTWLQVVAEGWLVLEMTNSPFSIGLVAAAASFPTLLFSLFGGVIVDRFSKRKIIIFTQVSAMVMALIYGLLTVFHLITVEEIIILAFLLGVVNSLDSPARQAFVVELVSKDQLASAISLNSGTFNAARVIGPSIAGILIGLVGTGGAFIINGLSYLAVIFALNKIDTKEETVKDLPHPIKAIKEGLTYSFFPSSYPNFASDGWGYISLWLVLQHDDAGDCQKRLPPWADRLRLSLCCNRFGGGMFYVSYLSLFQKNQSDHFYYWRKLAICS